MATKDLDAAPPEGADQPPQRLARTTVAGIVCLVFGGLSLLMSLWQVLALTAFGGVMQGMQSAQRAQLAELQAKQEEAAAAAREAEVKVIEAELAEAKLAGKLAQAVQLETRLEVVRSRPVAVAPIPGSEMLKFQEMFDTPAMKAWQLGAGLFYIVLSGLMVAAGVGLLQRRAWGRRLGVGSTATTLAIGLIGGIGSCVVMGTAMDLGPLFRSPVGLIAVLSGVCAFGCSAGIPAGILIVLTTRAVREEFAAFAAYGGS